MSMERISRALELAARQRESRAAAPRAVPSPIEPDTARTATFRAPLMELDPVVAEREHILPPNAGGEHGRHYKLRCARRYCVASTS